MIRVAVRAQRDDCIDSLNISTDEWISYVVEYISLEGEVRETVAYRDVGKLNICLLVFPLPQFSKCQRVWERNRESRERERERGRERERERERESRERTCMSCNHYVQTRNMSLRAISKNIKWSWELWYEKRIIMAALRLKKAVIDWWTDRKKDL